MYVKHEKNDEQFLHIMDEFCADTVKMLKREDVCPKSARWLGAYEIVDICQKLHTAAHYANNIKVTNSKEAEERHAAQTSAMAYIMTLGEKFTFCCGLYSINVDKLNRWLKRKADAQSWLSAWQRSDDRRFQNVK